MTMPLSQSVNLHSKFEVSMFTHYKDMNGGAKCRIWDGMGVMGDRMTSYSTE